MTILPSYKFLIGIFINFKRFALQIIKTYFDFWLRLLFLQRYPTQHMTSSGRLLYVQLKFKRLQNGDVYPLYVELTDIHQTSRSVRPSDVHFKHKKSLIYSISCNPQMEVNFIGNLKPTINNVQQIDMSISGNNMNVLQ